MFSFISFKIKRIFFFFTLKALAGSHLVTASLLTAARAPGFQIRNRAVAARGHTDRQGRSRAASCVGTARKPLLWFAAPLNLHTHLEDSLPRRRNGFLVSEENFFLFFLTDRGQIFRNNKHSNYLISKYKINLPSSLKRSDGRLILEQCKDSRWMHLGIF